MDDKDLEEYRAGAPLLNSLVSLRFTLLGLFVAGVALLMGSKDFPMNGPAIIVLTIAVWIIELRNRIVVRRVQNRLREIEKKWPKPEQREYRLFNAADKAATKLRLFCWLLDWPESKNHGMNPCDAVIGHGFAIDLLMTVVLFAGIALTISRVFCS